MYDQTEDCSINPSIEGTQYRQIDAPDDNCFASSRTHDEHDGSRQAFLDQTVERSTQSSSTFVRPDSKVEEPKPANPISRDIEADK